MGFRFRKTINLGGGFKINLSKSGVGYSWGTKGVRYTKTASGKTRTTLSIPGTGISHVMESGGTKPTAKQNTSQKTSNISAPNPNHTNNGGSGMAWIKFAICFFFGIFGVHKFMEKKIGMGLLYLFTMGLLGFGWLFDCGKYLITALKSSNIHIDIEKYIPDSVKTSADSLLEKLPIKRGLPIKTILLWVLVFFLGLIALIYLPHISGFIALAAIAIVIPIAKWQSIITRFVNGKKKTIIATVMAVLAFFGTPTADVPEAEPVEATIAAVEFSRATEATAPETEVTVPEIIDVESICFDTEQFAIGVGRTVDIPFTLSPENATDITLEASVNNAKIAEFSLVNEDARSIQITGIAPGDAVITLKANAAVVASKEITVFEVMPETITIVPDKEKPVIGSNGAFTIAFAPVDVTDQNVTWESSNPDVLIVNEDGTYEALSIGTATITATHGTEVVGTLETEVTPIMVESITLTSNWDPAKEFYKKNTMNLSAEILPVDAADKSIVWESSDESVATVSKKGVVTAVATGNVTITATSKNGVQGKYDIFVAPSPQKFRVTASISMRSNDHVGNRWSTGFEFNGEPIKSGSTVSIMPGDSFTAYGWAEDGDSNPEYGDYGEKLTLTAEMCQSGFTIEGEADVYENGGRYSGNCATWYVKMVFKPVN